MHIDPIFQKLLSVDTTRPEYINFKNALLEVDWTLSDYIKGTRVYLNYAPGFYFCRRPWIYDFYKSFFENFEYSTDKRPDITRARSLAIPFLDYLESLLDGYKIIKTEVMATQPEVEDQRKNLAKMHIDTRSYHDYCIRCQLGIETNSNSFLFVEDQKLVLTEGDVFAFDNRKCHWGSNYGDTIKIVIMFDIIRPRDWEVLPAKVKDNFFEHEFSLEDTKTMNQFIARFRKLYRV